jgi:DNA polymerase-4
MSIFGDFTPDVKRISIDEAFLDVTGTGRLFGSPEETARKLKIRVRMETGLTVSIGAAGNRYIAKIASARSKPDGLLVIAEGGEEAFLEQLPLTAMWGIGGKTIERLSELGLVSVTRIRTVPEKTLQSILGVYCGSFLFSAARGMDPGIFPDETRSRSISSETTFEQDVSDSEILESTILGMAQELMFRLMEEGFRSKTIHLKLRYDDFETLSAQETLSRWIVSTDDIKAAALALLERKRDRKRPIRLLGVGLGNLECDGGIVQNELFEGSSERSSRVERAVLELRKKKGALVTRARLVAAPSTSKKK